MAKHNEATLRGKRGLTAEDVDYLIGQGLLTRQSGTPLIWTSRNPSKWPKAARAIWYRCPACTVGAARHTCGLARLQQMLTP